MKALIYNGPWDMSLEEAPKPIPKEGEALLKVEAVGICGSDVHGFTGESGRRKPGMVMGHEFAGKIVEIPSENNRFKVGDTVTVYNNKSCRSCVHCLNGNEQRCTKRTIIGVNAGTWGAMAEYLACPTDLIFGLNQEIDPALALFAEPVGVAVHAIRRMAPQPTDVIGIVGSGTIGMGLAMTLKAKGFHNIFSLDVLDSKLSQVADMGAHPINVSQVDPREEICHATNGLTATGVFEAVGSSATVRNAYDLLGPGGKLVLIGNLASEFSLPLQGITDQEITIYGSYGFSQTDFLEAVKLINDKAVPVESMISGHCTLEETPEVMTSLARGELEALKMVITFD